MAPKRSAYPPDDDMESREVGLRDLSQITGYSDQTILNYLKAGHVVKNAHGRYDLCKSVQGLLARLEEKLDGKTIGKGEFNLDEEKARKEHYLANMAARQDALDAQEAVNATAAVSWIRELLANIKSQVRSLEVTPEQREAILTHIRSATLPGFASGQVDLEE